MRGGRTAAVCGFAMLAIFARSSFGQTPAADERFYTLRLTDASPHPRIEWTLGYGSWSTSFSGSSTARVGGWEVSIGYDPERCAVFCAYRRLPGANGIVPAFGLLPPIATIRIHTDSGSQPTTWIADPAGLRFPTVRDRGTADREIWCVAPGNNSPEHRSVSGTLAPVDSALPAGLATAKSSALSSAHLPLRV